MNATRFTSTLGAGAVAGIAAWSSWSHMVATALHVGERPEVAYLLPLSVDGLLVVELLSRRGRAARTEAPSAAAPSTVDATDDPTRPVVRAPRESAPQRRSTAAKIGRLAARMPDASAATIAAGAGVSESTARRHLAATRAPEMASAEA